jgi:TRAP-type transport system small permease protein
MTFQGLQNVVARLFKALLILLVLMMFIVVGINVFSRYILNASLGWADELARFLFIYVSLLGAVLAYHHNDHVALDIFLSGIRSPRVLMVLRVFGQLLIVGALAIFTRYSWDVAVSARNVSPALYIPMRHVYGVMPVAGFIMFVQAILKLRPILEGRALADTHASEREALEAAAELGREAEELSKYLTESSREEGR